MFVRANFVDTYLMSFFYLAHVVVYIGFLNSQILKFIGNAW